MKKKHKRVNSGCMKRTSRIYLKELNKGKVENIKTVLNVYHNVTRYIITRLWSDCEERGIELSLKSPDYTSQRCSVCGNVDKRNPNGEMFLCLSCGHTDNADRNASKNLELLGLEGVYSLSLLPNFDDRNKVLYFR